MDASNAIQKKIIKVTDMTTFFQEEEEKDAGKRQKSLGQEDAATRRRSRGEESGKSKPNSSSD